MEVSIPQTVFGELMVLSTCLVGDHLLETSGSDTSPWVKAITDSLTHGLVAFFSWMVVRSDLLHWIAIAEMILCLIVAMGIDVDHFIAAQAFDLKSATSLSQRPPFHNTSLLILVTLVLITLIKTWPLPLPYIVNRFPWIFFIAWVSHHVRDATRRGLWFWPFGSTKALPKWLYLSLVMLVPMLVKFSLTVPNFTEVKAKSSDKTMLDV